jgi:hypothetical protein
MHWVARHASNYAAQWCALAEVAVFIGARFLPISGTQRLPVATLSSALDLAYCLDVVQLVCHNVVFFVS